MTEEPKGNPACEICKGAGTHNVARGTDPYYGNKTCICVPVESLIK